MMQLYVQLDTTISTYQIPFKFKKPLQNKAHKTTRLNNIQLKSIS